MDAFLNTPYTNYFRFGTVNGSLVHVKWNLAQSQCMVIIDGFPLYFRHLFYMHLDPNAYFINIWYSDQVLGAWLIPTRSLSCS